MNKVFENRAELKRKFRNREKMFAGWVSFSHPSITETFCRAEFDFMAIDMEHSTISLEEAQRIIAASQSEGVPCLPRPVNSLINSAELGKSSPVSPSTTRNGTSASCTPSGS